MAGGGNVLSSSMYAVSTCLNRSSGSGRSLQREGIARVHTRFWRGWVSTTINSVVFRLCRKDRRRGGVVGVVFIGCLLCGGKKQTKQWINYATKASRAQ